MKRPTLTNRESPLFYMRLPLEGICEVPITGTKHAKGGGGTGSVLLKKFKGYTDVTVDNDVPWGHIVLNDQEQETTTTTTEWALLSLTLHHPEMDGMRHGKAGTRWVRIIWQDGAVDGYGEMRISSLTMWNYFGVRMLEETPLKAIGVSVCYLPKYLSAPVPVAEAVILKILRDGIVEEVSHQGRLMPGLGAKVVEALRSPRNTAYDGCFLEGDSFWVPLQIVAGARPVLLPVAVHRPTHESLVNFSKVKSIILDDALSPAPYLLPPPPPPSPISVSLDLQRSRLFSVVNAFLRGASTPSIFGVSGVSTANLRRVQLTVTEAARANGYSVETLRPRHGSLKLSGAALRGCWILRVSKFSEIAIHGLLKSFMTLHSHQEVRGIIILLLLEKTSFEPRLTALLSGHHRVDPMDVDTEGIIAESSRSLQQLEPQLTSESALKRVKAHLRHSSTVAEIPQVHWDEIAGCENAKKQLRTMLNAEENTTNRSGRRCGVLLYGPPGTGKTLLAKAVATEYSMSFISVKGPELLDVYVGESEAHIRDLFGEAKRTQPCIIFFDEIDSIGVKRGRDGDSGGVTDRLVSQLILEMDALTFDIDAQRVFMVGATNRLDLLDPALVRPGRFDQTIRLGSPQSPDEQVAILQIASRKYLLDMDVDLPLLARSLPLSLSPADLASICHGAMRRSMAKVIKRCAAFGTKPTSDYAVVVSMDDMLAAASQVVAGKGP